MSQSMNRKQKTGLVSFLMLFILAACLLSLPSEYGRRNSAGVRLPAVKLSDGRWLQVEHMSFGRVHEFHEGSRLIGKLQEWLPSGWRGPRARKVGFKTAKESLCIFLSIHPPPPGLLSGGFKVVSDSGETFATRWGSSYFNDGRVMMTPTLYEFPRNDPSFMLTGSVIRMPVAIEIPNPLYGQPSSD
jgi:hypothetical protein